MIEETVSLDQIIISLEEKRIYIEKDRSGNRFGLSITAWMKLYANLETPAYRAEMRHFSAILAFIFRDGTAFISDRGTFISKFASSAPYHYFLTTVDREKLTHEQPYSVAFHEIIDITVGEIVDSLHINFMAEMLWLANEYILAAQVPKMTVLYGMWMDPENKYDIPFDIKFIEIEMPEFGCHHSKISILKYKDKKKKNQIKIRIIISTANIYTADWQNRTQGLWVSPFLPLLPENANDSDGESPTNFKSDFIQYLRAYNQQEVTRWEDLIQRTDFSAINVFFIASVPGSHEGSYLDFWGHRKLAALMSKHVILPSDAQKWPVVAQSSSVGVFGNNYQSWISSSIVKAMSREKNKKIIFLADFKFIFPSQSNCSESYDMKHGSSIGLAYDKETHSKQQWIRDYLYQWKSIKIGRNQAVPHLKCYTRISPDESEIPWFVLTSSNLSKAAWGKMVKNGTCQYLCNYEAGVLFLPQFIINQNTFPIKESYSRKVPVFLIPYDLPLTPYELSDEPRLCVKPVGSLKIIEKNEKRDENTYVEESQNFDKTSISEEPKISETID